MMALEVRVKEVAQEHGIRNASELQRKAGLTYPQTSRLWQGGAMEHVSLPALSAIAKVLGVKGTDLLVDTDERAS
jgi:DNA-binding Xre family transcriptional regulator